MLASISPRRRELLASLGLDVTVLPSAYDEMPLPGLTPLEIARTHARGKAVEVASRCPEAIVVGADTVVDVDGQALGKPRDPGDAQAMLRRLSGREHIVHTAFTAVANAREIAGEVSTRVRFYPLEEGEIRAYVASGEPMDKAGGYGIQGRGATLVERIDGDFYTVMGFPLAHFVRTLAANGLHLAAAGGR